MARNPVVLRLLLLLNRVNVIDETTVWAISIIISSSLLGKIDPVNSAIPMVVHGAEDREVDKPYED